MLWFQKSHVAIMLHTPGKWFNKRRCSIKSCDICGTSNAAWSWRSTNVGQLEDLDDFTNYTLTMQIVVEKNMRYDAVGGEMLLKSSKLWKILYKWKTEEIHNAEVLLQGLQPHFNLRKLELRYYPGAGLPTWMMSQLCHLKVLLLIGLSEVEYMESSSINSGDDDELVFFPSLEELMLWDMPKLKGWWKSSSESEESETPQAPKLFHLDIYGCPELTTFPLCPGSQELHLEDFNEALGPIMRETTHGLSVSNNNHKEDQGRLGRLREVDTDNVGYLTSLPIHYLSDLRIRYDQKMEELKTGEVGEVFRSSRLSSLRSLVIWGCFNLKSISGRGVWDHFTALESLSLSFLDELELEDEDDVSNSSSDESTGEGCIEMPWRYLAPTLRSLKFIYLSIPLILSFVKLKTMPKEMRHLTSLAQLALRGCSTELINECRKKNGANWSNIQHIPNIIYQGGSSSELNNGLCCSISYGNVCLYTRRVLN